MLCIDGGLICVPVAVKIAGALGLGGIAMKIWRKCRKGTVPCKL